MRHALIAVGLITRQARSFAEASKASVQAGWPGVLEVVSGN